MIDFEFYATIALLNMKRDGVHFDATAHLLYVDRRGAPENAQLGFDTVDIFTEAVGIDSAESARYLGVIEQRLAKRQTGASWQLARLAQLRQSLAKKLALHGMLEEFIEHSDANVPVAEWPL